MSVAAGEQLRAAREARGLTVEDIAARLKVPARYVRALEQGDLTALPEPTFVRGYVKSYARTLGLDAEPLVAQWSPVEVKAPRPLVAVDGVAGTPARKGRAPNFRAGSRRGFGLLALAAGAVALGVFLWLALPATPPESPAAVGLPAPAGDAATPPSAGTPVSIPVALPAPAGATQDIALPLPAPAASPEAPAAAAAAVTTPAPAATPAAAPAVQPAVPAEARQGDVPARGVYIRFAGTSWVEVRDADNVVLHTSVKMAGDQLAVDGKAPLAVTFNDATVAEVWYNGVRQASRPGGPRVNRLILGQAAR